MQANKLTINLLSIGRRCQVVRRQSAKLTCSGSIPLAASLHSSSRSIEPLAASLEYGRICSLGSARAASNRFRYALCALLCQGLPPPVLNVLPCTPRTCIVVFLAWFVSLCELYYYHSNLLLLSDDLFTMPKRYTEL